ncbi:MAG: ATP cone domain-containing protein [Candidatus Pacearchaeota archaeon]
MYVIKASGKKEEFNSDKIFRTLEKAGASKELAMEIVSKVQKKVHDGTTTKEILNSALRLLRNRNPVVCERYDLKRAIMSLGPTGFPFEKFFSRILENYGYKTEVGQIVKGRITRHEIDIIAEKNSKRYMVELKYHNSLGIYTRLKTVLYVYARFLDLKGKFDQPWIATNTKLSHQARRYADGMHMKITSWEYPEGKSLSEMIDYKKLYPVTILKSVNKKIIHQLCKADMMLSKDLLDIDEKELMKRTNLSLEMVQRILKEARQVCG